MNKNLICIVGRTASGKDTIVQRLKTHGLKPVVSHTTRPIRPSEENGREHYFITNEEADRLLKYKDNIAAYTEIKGNRYFTTIDALDEAHIYVIDPEGIKYLKTAHPEINLIIAYVKCNKDTYISHSESRGDNIKDFKDRYAAENAQFNAFEAEHKWSMLIENDSTLEDLYAKADELADFYKNNTNEFLNEYLMEQYPDDYSNIIMFECSNYRSAVVGVSDDHRLIYNYDKMIEHLMKYDHMNYDEAMEWIDYNTIRALPYYPNGPIIMYGITDL